VPGPEHPGIAAKKMEKERGTLEPSDRFPPLLPASLSLEHERLIADKSRFLDTIASLGVSAGKL
jgi:hypothetical protein